MIAALTLAACGSDDGGDTTAADTGSAETTAPTKPPVKVGLVVPENVTTVSDPYSRPALEAAANSINDRGGLDGHEVEVVYCNDKGDPNETAKCGRQLKEEGVLYVTGGQVLNDAILVKSLGPEIPLIGFNAYTTAYQAPNSFLYSGGSFFNYQALSGYAAHEGMKPSLVSADVSTAAPLRDILNGVIEDAGGKFANEVLVPPTQADMSPIVAAAQKGDADAAMMFVAPTQNVQFLKAAGETGADFTFLLGYGLSSEAKEQVGAETVGSSIYASSFKPFDSDIPIMEQFREELEAAEAAGIEGTALGEQTDYSFSAWLSLQAVERVIAGAGVSDVNAGTLKAAMSQAKNIDLGGAIPPWTPSAKGPEGFDRVSNATVYVIAYKEDGSTELLTPEPVSIEQAIAGEFG